MHAAPARTVPTCTLLKEAPIRWEKHSLYIALCIVFTICRRYLLYDLLFIASVHLREIAKPARIYCI